MTTSGYVATTMPLSSLNNYHSLDCQEPHILLDQEMIHVTTYVDMLIMSLSYSLQNLDGGVS